MKTFNQIIRDHLEQFKDRLYPEHYDLLKTNLSTFKTGLEYQEAYAVFRDLKKNGFISIQQAKKYMDLKEVYDTRDREAFCEWLIKHPQTMSDFMNLIDDYKRTK